MEALVSVQTIALAQMAGLALTVRFLSAATFRSLGRSQVVLTEEFARIKIPASAFKPPLSFGRSIPPQLKG